MEKAAQYSLENIMIDLKELEKGMELTRREMENRAKDKSKSNPTLQDFVARAGETVAKLRQDGDAAQVTYFCYTTKANWIYHMQPAYRQDRTHTYFVRGSITVWMTSSFICLE